jgi:heat shock protein HtpX
MALFFAIIIGLGYFASSYFGNPNILYFFIGFSIIMNIVSYWFSDKIALMVSGAKPASADRYPDFYQAVEKTAKEANLPMPKLYVINDPAPNAFATGRNKNHAAVAATTGLLSALNKDELEGVFSHEMSHIGNRDILLSTVVVVLVGFVSILSNMFMRSMLWGGMRRDDRDNNMGGILAVVGIALSILSPIVATLIQLAISRKREFLADASGAMLSHHPENLASALEKIGKYSRPMISANNATAHLFIANPFGSMRGITKLFMTHPPIEERVAILREM